MEIEPNKQTFRAFFRLNVSQMEDKYAGLPIIVCTYVACFFRFGCQQAVLGTIAAINLDDRALIAINYERIALGFPRRH